MSPESTANDGCALRLFVAIPVPPEVKVSLREVQARLKRILPPDSCAWTRAENMHLTLRFLGNVAATKVPEISHRLRESLSGFGSMELNCSRLGCFPDSRFPRVVWAQVRDEADARLTLLHRQVNVAVARFVEKPAEGRFVGHITLARPKGIKRADADNLRRFLESQGGIWFGTWSCETVELIQSELSPQGSRYTTLDVFRL